MCTGKNPGCRCFQLTRRKLSHKLPCMTAPKDIGQRVKEARVEAGLTQHELAERAGITDRTIRNLESGRSGTPQRRILNGLASVLGDVVTELHVPEAAMPSTGRGETHADRTADVEVSPVGAHQGV